MQNTITVNVDFQSKRICLAVVSMSFELEKE